MSNPTATVGNGCSLEDCYTNIFALSEFRDIQYVKYTYSQKDCGSLSSSAGDNPLLKAYTTCLNNGLLCSWNRVRRQQDSITINNDSFSKPHHFTNFDLELWVFWFGESKPNNIGANFAPGVVETKRGGWSVGTLEYDSRTAFFKALLGVIERCFLQKGYVRMGKWFVPCSKTLKTGSASTNMEYSLHYNFFLHGENIVCATLDIRHLPPIRHLLPSDLQALNRKGPNARLPVILSPYGINSQLCSTALLHPQSQDQEDLRLRELHRRWREFYNLPIPNVTRDNNNTFESTNSHSNNSRNDHDSNDVSKLPPMVEVIIASHRSFYPSFLVMLSVEPNSHNNNNNNTNNQHPNVTETLSPTYNNISTESKPSVVETHSHHHRPPPPPPFPHNNIYKSKTSSSSIDVCTTLSLSHSNNSTTTNAIPTATTTVTSSSSAFPPSTDKKITTTISNGNIDFLSILNQYENDGNRERQDVCVNQLLTNRAHDRTLMDSLVMKGTNFYSNTATAVATTTNSTTSSDNLDENSLPNITNVLLDPSAPVHCRCRRHNRRGEKRRRGTISRLYSSLTSSQKLRLRTDHDSTGPGRMMIGNDIDNDNQALEESDLGITYIDMESLCSRLHSPPPVCAPFPCETADPTMPTLSPQQAIPNCGAPQQPIRERSLSATLENEDIPPKTFLPSTTSEIEKGRGGSDVLVDDNNSVALNNVVPQQPYSPMMNDQKPDVVLQPHSESLPFSSYHPPVVTSSSSSSSKSFTQTTSVNYELPSTVSVVVNGIQNTTTTSSSAAATAAILQQNNKLLSRPSGKISKSVFSPQHPTRNWLWQCAENMMSNSSEEMYLLNDRKRAHGSVDNDYWHDNCYSEPISPLNIDLLTTASSTTDATTSTRRPVVFPIHFSSFQQKGDNNSTTDIKVSPTTDFLNHLPIKSSRLDESMIDEESSLRGNPFTRGTKTPFFPMVNKPTNGISVLRSNNEIAHMLPTPPSNEMMNQPMLSPAVGGVMSATAGDNHGALFYHSMVSAGNSNITGIVVDGTRKSITNAPFVVNNQAFNSSASTSHTYLSISQQAHATDTEETMLQNYFGLSFISDKNEEASLEWSFLKSTRSQRCVGKNYENPTNIRTTDPFLTSVLPRMDHRLPTNTSYEPLLDSLSHSLQQQQQQHPLHTHTHQLHPHSHPHSHLSHHHNHPLSLNCIATGSPSKTGSLLKPVNSHQSALPAPLLYSSSQQITFPFYGGSSHPSPRLYQNNLNINTNASSFVTQQQYAQASYLSYSNSSSINTLPQSIAGATSGGGGAGTNMTHTTNINAGLLQPLSVDRGSASYTPTPSSSHRGAATTAAITGSGGVGVVGGVGTGNFSIPFTNQTSQLALTGNGGILSSVGISGALHRNSSIYREADSLWLVTLLSDSLFNLIKDHNFDSCCNICECSRSALGSEVGLYVAYHPPNHELPAHRLSMMSKPRMFTNVTNNINNSTTNTLNQPLSASAKCNCAFSAVANRRRASVSNLFYEDEVDITGIRCERRPIYKLSIWSQFLSQEDLLPPEQHGNFYSSLPNASQLYSMFIHNGTITSVFDEFMIRSLMHLHRYEQTIVVNMRKRCTFMSEYHYDATTSASMNLSCFAEAVQPNVLEYQDGTEWCLLALEQTTLTSDGTVQPYNEEQQLQPAPLSSQQQQQNHSDSLLNNCLEEGNDLVLSKLFHRITPPDIPDSYSDQIRLLKTIRPWLQDALGATRTMEYAFTVEGPLTWAGFHKLAGRGQAETCEPQPVSQLQLCIVQDQYSLLGSGQQQLQQQVLTSSSSSMQHSDSFLNSSSSLLSSSSNSNIGMTNSSLLAAAPKFNLQTISCRGHSPLNELLRLTTTNSRNFCDNFMNNSYSTNTSAPWTSSSSSSGTASALAQHNLHNIPIMPSLQTAMPPSAMSDNNDNEICGAVISPYAIGLWDQLNLAPYSKSKHVICLLLSPNESQILSQCKIYLDQLKQTYERCHLGKFILLDRCQTATSSSSSSLGLLMQSSSDYHSSSSTSNANGNNNANNNNATTTFCDQPIYPGVFPIDCPPSDILCNVLFNNPTSSSAWDKVCKILHCYVNAVCDRVSKFSSTCSNSSLNEDKNNATTTTNTNSTTSTTTSANNNTVTNGNNIENDPITLAVENHFKKARLDFSSIVNGYHKLSSQAKKLVSLFPYCEKNEESLLTSAYTFNNENTTNEPRDFAECYLSIYLINPFTLAVDHHSDFIDNDNNAAGAGGGGKDHQQHNYHAPLTRLIMQSMMSCIDKCKMALPAYWRDRCTIQLLPVNELLPTSSTLNVTTDALQQERLLLMAMATYAALDRVVEPSVCNSNRSLTQIGPSAEKERTLLSYKKSSLSSFPKKVSAPPYILANSVYRSMIAGLANIPLPLSMSNNNNNSNTHNNNSHHHHNNHNTNNANSNDSSSTYFLLSHSTQPENVLLVSYCLSNDLHWLLAVCTDEVGSFQKHTVINIWIPDIHKRRKASARKHALDKLWDWIMSVVAATTQAWRLVIGRLGRIGHGELIGLEGLTSRKHLQRSNARLKCSMIMKSRSSGGGDQGDCSHCPRFLGACVTCLELHPSLRVYTGAVQQEERASSALPITTPRDTSVTHLLVFPTSTSINALQDVDTMYPLDHTLEMLNFDLDDTEPFNLCDIFNGGLFDGNFSFPGENESCATASSNMQDFAFLDMNVNGSSTSGGGHGGNVGSNANGSYNPANMFFPGGSLTPPCRDSVGNDRLHPNTDNGMSDSDPQLTSLMQQPLAMGYYVSTAPTGPLPSWLWCAYHSQDPFQESAADDSSGHLQSTHCFLAALHLQTTLVCANGSNDPNAPPKPNMGIISQTVDGGAVSSSISYSPQPTLPPHPLDSNTTCDVLRYVLETYHALSWLTMDPLRKERRTCLPVHMLTLLQLYHAQNAFL